MFNALCFIDPKRSTGADHLNPRLLLSTAQFLVELSTYIFNLTLETESVSAIWKSAFILPLHKGCQSNDLNNYRPIPKLSRLAKVFEKLVNGQVRIFFITTVHFKILTIRFYTGA